MLSDGKQMLPAMTNYRTLTPLFLSKRPMLNGKYTGTNQSQHFCIGGSKWPLSTPTPPASNSQLSLEEHRFAAAAAYSISLLRTL